MEAEEKQLTLQGNIEIIRCDEEMEKNQDLMRIYSARHLTISTRKWITEVKQDPEEMEIKINKYCVQKLKKSK